MHNENAIKIFIAYSREDTVILKRLRTNLKVLERTQNVEVWYDGEIEAGSNWEQTIKEHLYAADIILLLISENFIASDDLYDQKMTQALSLHDEGKAIVIPVIAKHCLWQDTPFARLKTLPENGKPLNSKEWWKLNRPYTQVVKELKKLVLGIRGRRNAEKIVRKGKANREKPSTDPDTPKTDSFFSKNKNRLGIAVGILALILVGVLAIPKVFPKTEKKASSETEQTSNDSTPQNKEVVTRDITNNEGEKSIVKNESSNKEEEPLKKIPKESEQAAKDEKESPKQPEENSNSVSKTNDDGILLDTRDGQRYKTAKLPDGNIWMAQNLNFKTSEGSYCHNNKDANCNQYGRLYTLKEAKIACPNGWHLPTKDEWDNLIGNYGGAGKNSYQQLTKNEFAALPAGRRYKGGDFDPLPQGGYWSATKVGASYGWSYTFNKAKGEVSLYNAYKAFAFSCRCVKD